jgi:hypothetical protein
MAKKTSRGKSRRKVSQTKDLPVDRKARTVKGGAFSPAPGTVANRNTVGGAGFTLTSKSTTIHI